MKELILRLTRSMPRSCAGTLFLFSFLLSGCALRQPNIGANELGIKNIVFIEPRIEKTKELKLIRPDWAGFISADELIAEQFEINGVLPSWADKVTVGFSDSFVNLLKTNGYMVTRLTHEEYVSRASPAETAIVVSSFIQPGFVYKTITSKVYKPYVLVSMSAAVDDRRFLRKQVFVATDRSFNFFMTNLPASTPYDFPSIGSLRAAPQPALEALATLSRQLGKTLASDLLDRNP